MVNFQWIECFQYSRFLSLAEALIELASQAGRDIYLPNTLPDRTGLYCPNVQNFSVKEAFREIYDIEQGNKKFMLKLL